MSHLLELAMDQAPEGFQKTLPASVDFREPHFWKQNILVSSTILKLYTTHCIICGKII